MTQEQVEKLQIGDKVLYCPFYVSRYSKKYEGTVLSLSKDGNTAICELGFGKKRCSVNDLVKLPNL